MNFVICIQKCVAISNGYIRTLLQIIILVDVMILSKKSIYLVLWTQKVPDRKKNSTEVFFGPFDINEALDLDY